MLKLTKMATVRNFGVICVKFNIVWISTSVNYALKVNMFRDHKFVILHSLYKKKPLMENKRHCFFPGPLVLLNEIITCLKVFLFRTRLVHMYEEYHVLS